MPLHIHLQVQLKIKSNKRLFWQVTKLETKRQFSKNENVFFPTHFTFCVTMKFFVQKLILKYFIWTFRNFFHLFALHGNDFINYRQTTVNWYVLPKTILTWSLQEPPSFSDTMLVSSSSSSTTYISEIFRTMTTDLPR